jgi:hypothetical protein
MLHSLNLNGWEDKAWCVPSAVAILTGASAMHMHSRAAFMRDITLKEVKELYVEEAILLLREQKYKVQQIALKDRWPTAPTLRRFFAGRTPYEFVMPVLVFTGDHALTCHMGYACDNWTKRPVPVSEFPKLKRPVQSAFIVMQDRTL